MRPQERALQIKSVVPEGLCPYGSGAPQGASLQSPLLCASAHLHSSVLLPTEKERKPLQHYLSALREEGSYRLRKVFLP